MIYQKVLRVLFKKIVRQGNHIEMRVLWAELYLAHLETFTEDNKPTLRALMHEAIDRAIDG